MSRLMLDTCIVFDMLTNFDGLYYIPRHYRAYQTDFQR